MDERFVVRKMDLRVYFEYWCKQLSLNPFNHQFCAKIDVRWLMGRMNVLIRLIMLFQFANIRFMWRMTLFGFLYRFFRALKKLVDINKFNELAEKESLNGIFFTLQKRVKHFHCELIFHNISIDFIDFFNHFSFYILFSVNGLILQ